MHTVFLFQAITRAERTGASSLTGYITEKPEGIRKLSFFQFTRIIALVHCLYRALVLRKYHKKSSLLTNFRFNACTTRLLWMSVFVQGPWFVEKINLAN